MYVIRTRTSQTCVQSFTRDESGSMTIFAIFLLLMMLTVGGLGVDLMRNEMERTKLQNTLDRAILAAADLDQTQASKTVVNDYFAKSGLGEESVKVTVDEGVNYRTVTAQISTNSPATYMAGLGVDELPIFVGGTATEWVPNLEVSLVLDISGSMRFDKRMDNLKPAAKAFMTTLLQGDMAAHTSLNVIPYAGQTNPGPFMFNRLKGQRYPQIPLPESKGGVELLDDSGEFVYPQESSCLELGSQDFDHAELPKQNSYAQTAHFMNWDIAADVMDWGWCPSDDVAIQYAQNNLTTLHEFIDDMRMHDGTGTPYGMKYALALLDPSSKDDFEAMATAGLVPTEFRNRPANWDDSETAKYIVLMTDGQITSQLRPKDQLDEDNPTVELQFRSGDRETIASKDTMVSRFYEICDLAKDPSRNVIVYTIAFEAPSAAQTQMRKCASSPSHYFKAEGSEIDEVFQAIARQVLQLRLVY